MARDRVCVNCVYLWANVCTFSPDLQHTILKPKKQVCCHFMSTRTHMIAPDGRTFTFKEWCDYLKQPGHDTGEPYRLRDGSVFQVDGFIFNVHGACLNPHVIHIAPEGDRIGGVLTYCNLRTYRRPFSRHSGKVVWWWDAFGLNDGSHALGRLGPFETDDENEAIVRGLRQVIESQTKQIEWYQRDIDVDRPYDIDSGYKTSQDRVRKMRDLVRAELESRMQLTLF